MSDFVDWAVYIKQRLVPLLTKNGIIHRNNYSYLPIHPYGFCRFLKILKKEAIRQIRFETLQQHHRRESVSINMLLDIANVLEITTRTFTK
jgi:Na+-transporting methylmalonyl-CoA/oxaloacetate decarboxylase beta subunit